MAADSSSAGGRGHLIVRSHSPLPSFVCVVPVPPQESSIVQLRSTIIAIISGQISAIEHGQGNQTGHNGRTKKAAHVSTSANDEQALSYSEHLKQEIVQEWRLKSIVLELNQNAYIAPETRNRTAEGGQGKSSDPYIQGNGFVLLDEHEGALLEHGDEINVVLREGQTVESLRLPVLPSNHVFGLPNQPRLSRNGTVVASTHPSRTESADDYYFSPRTAPLLKPTEPSSHSSSVSANPDVNYETTLRHRSTPTNWHRVMVLDSNGVVQQKNDEGKVSANVSAAVKDGRRSKPRRLMSEGSNIVIGQSAKPNPPLRQQSATFSTLNSTENRKPTLYESPTMNVAHSPPLASPTISNREIIASQGGTNSLTKAERQQHEKIRKAGQRSLPSQALVIGHGVQGKVGRMNSSEGVAEGSQSETPGEYGNMDAFVSFTAASSEVHQAREKNGAGARRMSSRSATSGPDKLANSRTTSNTYISKPGLSGSPPLGADANGDLTAKKDKMKETKKKYVKIPERPQLPPIRNLVPFADEAHETLMPMPVASPILSVDPSSVASSKQPGTPMTQLEMQMANDAAIAQALSESLNVEDSQSVDESKSVVAQEAGPSTKTAPAVTNSNGRRSMERASSSPLLSRIDSSTSSSPNLTRRSSNSPQLSRDNDENVLSGTSKADRRYNEVKKALQAEKDRQTEQQRIRLEKARRASEEKMEAFRKAEHDRKQREEKIRWQMWQDIRSRQAKE